MEIFVGRSECIQSVKERISSKYDISMKKYVLIYNGMELNDKRFVCDYNMRANSWLQLNTYCLPKKKGKVYSKPGINIKCKGKPALFLNLTHLKEQRKIYDINFNIPWNTLIKNNIYKYLLNSPSNFDYFINDINENDKISHDYNGSLSFKAKLGDTIIVRLKPEAPLPAKEESVDDAEFIPSVKPLNFNNMDDEKGEITIEKVIEYKEEINKKIVDTLLNIEDNGQYSKLSSLMELESFNGFDDNFDDDGKIKDDIFGEESHKNKGKKDLNLNYKLHLDLDYDQELKNKDDFYQNIKEEIAQSLNVDINSVHINAVQRGSVILIIAIDEKGATDVYKDAVLTSAQFDKWSINRCLKGKVIDGYYGKKDKNFNPNTSMWTFLRNKFGDSTFNAMKQQSINKYNSLKSSHPTLIEPLSFDQIAAIYLYTTNYLYKALNYELRDGKSEFADFTVELVVGINKLPMVWTKTYRGLKSNFKTYHSYIPDVYKKGAVVRWDAFNSTTKELGVAKGFAGSKWIIEIEGYHGRDIQPFSAYATEAEVIYTVSSHFLITNVYNQDGYTFYKCKEMAFPWNQKAILWVDDRPTNNKGLIEQLEQKGIMVVPRISTHDAMQFINYMKNIFLNNDKFNQFRIISDMTRHERTNENDENSATIKNRTAGAVLVNELRKQGYNHQVCIYCSNENRAKDECAKFGHSDNIIATTSTSKCYQFADY